MNRDADLKLKEMFRKLYPRLTDEELERARVNFDRYLALVVGIVDRDNNMIDDSGGAALP